MSMQDTAPQAEISDDTAVARIYDLVRNGEVANDEFAQLDSMIYARLLQAYGSETPSPHRGQFAA